MYRGIPARCTGACMRVPKNWFLVCKRVFKIMHRPFCAQAAAIAQQLESMGWIPDLVLASNATRTKQVTMLAHLG